MGETTMRVLTAFCDLQTTPISYDFVTWLIRAMKERDDRKSDHLHVVLVPNDGGRAGFARHWGEHDDAATRWRFWHIVVASIPLAKATVTVAASRAHAETLKTGEIWWPEGRAHFVGPIVEASRKGEQIPTLQATEQARRYVASWLGKERKHIVSLTLRNQTTDPARNSEVLAWRRFAGWLEDKGYGVVVLDDSNIALANGQGYAELDPDLRLALYERAAMNCICNNGPQELLEFSVAPYLTFCQAMNQGWQDHWKKYFYMNPGEQFPWARADQRLIYRLDSFETLKEEFSAWESCARVAA